MPCLVVLSCSPEPWPSIPETDMVYVEQLWGLRSWPGWQELDDRKPKHLSKKSDTCGEGHQSDHFPSWHRSSLSLGTGLPLQTEASLEQFLSSTTGGTFKILSLGFKTPETLDKSWLIVRVLIKKKLWILIIWISLPMDSRAMGVSAFSKQINQNYYKPSRRWNHFGSPPAFGNCHIWPGSCYSFLPGFALLDFQLKNDTFTPILLIDF